MKRYGNLYPQITDFANLLAAARQARRGKRFGDRVLAFHDRLETELIPNPSWQDPIIKLG